MFRSRLKKAVKRAAIKLFDMEFDTEERDPAARAAGRPGEVDPDKIPRIVDGDGDTPGPNHKEDIGRPFLSAQIIGGFSPLIIDTRPPQELMTGRLPGAVALPGRSLLDTPDVSPADLLPDDRDRAITVYDATGEQSATEVAAALREAGWAKTRQLRGGFAEWLEQGEQVDPPAALQGGHKQGARVTVDGGEAWVLADVDEGRLRVWTDRLREVPADAVEA